MGDQPEEEDDEEEIFAYKYADDWPEAMSFWGDWWGFDQTERKFCPKRGTLKVFSH